MDYFWTIFFSSVFLLLFFHLINWFDEQKEERIDGWMDGWMDGRTDGRMDGWTDVRRDGRTNGWMDRRMDKWIAGWMKEWMEGRRNGWTDGQTEGWTKEQKVGWTDGRMDESLLSYIWATLYQYPLSCPLPTFQAPPLSIKKSPTHQATIWLKHGVDLWKLNSWKFKICHGCFIPAKISSPSKMSILIELPVFVSIIQKMTWMKIKTHNKFRSCIRLLSLPQRSWWGSCKSAGNYHNRVHHIKQMIIISGPFIEKKTSDPWYNALN